MEYSIRQLAELSGVTARTLRWYEEIGLLKPSRVAESGYRYYGAAQVDRLQDILYYRELGVELGKIKECLDAPSFDRLRMLKAHLQALEERKAQVERLMESVKATINAEERKEIMDDKQKFEAFKKNLVTENEKNYGKEAREKYGDESVNASNAAMMNMNAEDYAAWTALGEEIQKRLETAVQEKAALQSDAGKEIAALHRRWLNATVKECDAGKHLGIAELYVADGRFKAYYDKQIGGCAQFLRDAVAHWAELI